MKTMKYILITLNLFVLNVFILNNSQACDFKYNQTNCCIDFTVNCEELFEYVVYLGDGAKIMSNMPGETYTHCYENVGNFPITVECYDDQGNLYDFFTGKVKILPSDLIACSTCDGCEFQTFRVDGTNAPRAIWIQEYNDGINTNPDYLNDDQTENRCHLADNVTSVGPNITIQNESFVSSVLDKVKNCFPDCDWSGAFMTWSLDGPIVVIEMHNWPVIFEMIYFVSNTTGFTPIQSTCFESDPCVPERTITVSNPQLDGVSCGQDGIAVNLSIDINATCNECCQSGKSLISIKPKNLTINGNPIVLNQNGDYVTVTCAGASYKGLGIRFKCDDLQAGDVIELDLAIELLNSTGDCITNITDDSNNLSSSYVVTEEVIKECCSAPPCEDSCVPKILVAGMEFACNNRVIIRTMNCPLDEYSWEVLHEGNVVKISTEQVFKFDVCPIGEYVIKLTYIDECGVTQSVYKNMVAPALDLEVTPFQTTFAIDQNDCGYGYSWSMHVYDFGCCKPEFTKETNTTFSLNGDLIRESSFGPVASGLLGGECGQANIIFGFNSLASSCDLFEVGDIVEICGTSILTNTGGACPNIDGSYTHCETFTLTQEDFGVCCM